MTIGAVILAVWLTPGCKKNLSNDSTDTSAADTNTNSVAGTNDAAAATNAAANTALAHGKDLGVVQFTNRCETCIQVGDGKSCTIKPVLLDPQRLQLTMTLESRLADGKTRGLKIMTVIAKPDQPFVVDFGSSVFTLTPQLVTPPPQ